MQLVGRGLNNKEVLWFYFFFASTLQVATILVAMVHGFMFCKKSSLNQKSWLPNGDQAKKL